MIQRGGRIVFGPVVSRRLGRSLGIDLIASTICSYDCVYCECGRTTSREIVRREFVPVETAIGELDRALRSRPALDYVTFAGSGEPTLSLSLGRVIRYLRKHYPVYPVAVLTNGSLLWQKEVREELAPADLVIPTLVSTNEETFRRIHRPLPSLRLETILQGIAIFCEEFPGAVWLEVFVIPGLNTTPDELAGLRETIAWIHPAKVQLNTAHRPAAESWVRAVGETELGEMRKFLEGSGVPVEIIGRVHPAPNGSTLRAGGS